ncbi:MarR family winged helix-turn-helix transcriptional regulator [Streptomyces sp. UNOC14_S4]|uniref:MarR family winged helix-turn-helix transcriptional regulator n=1 Tax=Streptomyces sp. UNOC14_S4 TaxID=2872340 RepID=UPI001E3526FC|nr:MarR family transcriptional regulator [Streptomyces sp. UNOC14_S4]MCC3768418.1 MarR family transcriptional regulator [Streptomyces sp. UNOC14_S4]
MSADGLSDELAGVLKGIQRLARRSVWAGLAAPRLRGAQAELLRVVVERPGIGVSAAAKELYLAANSVSTLVNQLVRAGLLRRETDPRDGRAAMLHPTPACLERLRDLDARRGALFRDRLATLTPADRAALAAALPALRRLAESLRTTGEAP